MLITKLSNTENLVAEPRSPGSELDDIELKKQSTLSRPIENIGHRWTVTFTLTMTVATAIILLIAISTSLNFLRQREMLRQEFEDKATLLAIRFSDTLANPKDFSNLAILEDKVEVAVIANGNVSEFHLFLPDGSPVFPISRAEDSLGYQLTRQVVQGRDPILVYQDSRLLVVGPIQAGNNLLGIITFNVSTTSLTASLQAIFWDYIWQGFAILMLIVVVVCFTAHYSPKYLRILADAGSA